MLVKIIAVLKFIKWPYIIATEVIGLAGIPGDVNTWGVKLNPYVDFFNQWAVRAFLVVSGILVFTYPQWLPKLQKIKGRLFPKTTLPNTKPQLLKDLEWLMLQFIDAKFGEGLLRVTTSDILGHKPFMNISPGKLEKSRAHLRREGYVVAFDDDFRVVVTEITEKGRKTIMQGDQKGRAAKP